jgi:hypothetical protein
MPHDRNAPFHKVRNLLRSIGPALDLHRLAARLLHDPGGIQEGLVRIGLIGPERHVDDDKRLRRAPHHCLPVQDHHLHRHAHRRGQPVNHHADTVADEDQVRMLVHQRGHRRVIRRQANQRRAALGRCNIFDRLAARERLF